MKTQPNTQPATHTPTQFTNHTIGKRATVNKSNLPTLVASELSDYHAFNPAVISKVVSDRINLRWQDGHSAWFDRDAVVVLF